MDSLEQAPEPMAAGASFQEAITEVLSAAETTEEDVIDRVLLWIHLVYAQLHEMAHRHLAREPPGHPLSTYGPAQQVSHALKEATLGPAPGVSVDGLPGREAGFALGQPSPLTTGFIEVEEGVEAGRSGSAASALPDAFAAILRQAY